MTGQVLTPRELFITWLALGIPLVSAGVLRGFANDALTAASRNSDSYVGILVRPRGTLGADDAGHFAIYSNIGGNLTVRGYWPQEAGLPSQADELFDLLFNNRVPGRVQDDSIMLQQLNLSGVVHAQLNVTASKARRLTELMGDPGPRTTFYSFNPDNFADTFNCATWGCSLLNQVLDMPIQPPRQGRIKLALPLIGQLPSPWQVTITGPN